MGKFRIWVGMALIVAIAVAVNGSSSLAGDIDHGEQLARRWCSGCHLVAADQRQASADVPPFSVIARMPNFSPEKVAFFLLEPHPKMPNLALSRREADDIAAYIGSLVK
jgi:mono/diheme cytochrome c family protein